MKNWIYILGLLTLSTMVNAQTAATNTGILYISGGSDIFFAASNFTNNSGSALTNNGQLYVQGNVANDQSSMATGTGTLYLTGTSAQSVGGSQPFKTYHLTTNNTAGITLNSNLSVSGVHTFTNGIITTAATPNYLIYEAGSSYSGDGDTRHVNGWVKKMGATSFVFPVGNGTVERTTALTSLSASSEFNVKYAASTPSSNALQAPVWDVNESEYWTINKVSGGNASVTLNWDNSKVFFPNWILSDILVAGYNGSLWTDNGGAGTASGNVATTGTVTSSSISSFNLFALGSRSFILPLTLIDFTASRQNNYTRISWTTAREYDMANFIVERSDDGISFYPIAQLPGRNNGGTEQYSNLDYAAIQQTAYYRLRSIDINGRSGLSKTVSVSVTDDARLTLMASLVHDKAILMANSAVTAVFNYSIMAMNGQLIQKGNLNIQNGGSYEIPFNSNMAPGIYALEVNNGKTSYTYKLVVQ